MKIFITGGCGYLGSTLVGQLLNLGYQVKVYDNCSGRTTDSLINYCVNRNFEFVKGDILDWDLLSKSSEECDLVCHAAAMVGEPICNKFRAFAELVNYEGSRKIANLNKKTIFFSTGSVYGKVENVCTEESPCNPLSVYAKTKLWAENYLLSMGNSIVYRFATAFGLSGPATRLDLLPNDFAYQAFKNKSLVVAQPGVKRTFCHARDLMSAVCFAVKNFDKMRGQTYNIGNAEGNWSKQQLVDFIQKKTNCDVFYADCYKDTDLRDYEVSYKKINDLGWKAAISMEEGIEELIRAMPLINPNNQYVQKI